MDKDKDKKWSKKIVRFLAEWGVGEALSYLLSFVTWKTVLGAVIGVVAGLGTLLSHLPWPFILVLTVAGFAFAIFLINEVIFLVERVRASRTPIPDSKPPAAVQHRDVGANGADAPHASITASYSRTDTIHTNNSAA